MTESKVQTSFAAGELSPTLYARVDLDKFQIGAALMKNFIVDWRGGASNRPGTKYCMKALQNGARLMPFVFNTDITYMMEFGPGYIRFLSSGEPVYEPGLSVSTIAHTNPVQLTILSHGFVAGQEINVNVPGVPQLTNRNVLVNSVIDANTITVADIFGNPLNGTAYATPTAAGQVAAVYTITTPYQLADLFSLNFIQSADVVTIVHPNYVPYNLSRIAASQFTFTPDVPGPVIQPPTGTTAHPSLGTGGNVYGYVVTALNQDGSEESLMSVPATCISALLDQTATPQVTITIKWTAPNQVVSSYNIYKWGPIDKANGTPPTIFGYIGNTQSTSFTDNNIAADFSKVPEQFVDPFSPGQMVNLAVSAPGGYGTGGSVSYVPLTISGDGTGAAGYAVIDYSTGHCVGAFLTLTGKGYSVATVTAGSGGATFTYTLSPSNGTYPSVVAYVQQRRTFAAPTGDPQAITLSQTGNFDNFDTSPVVADSDSITMRLSSTEVDYIKSMTPMATGLVILTSGGAHLLSGGSPGAPLTPSSTTATHQASHGSSNLPAIVANYNLLYIQQKANTVRDMAFNFYLQSYVGADRSTLSQHLFTNYTLIQWAFAQEPLKLVCIVRDDGKMLTMTYLPEQEVYGWAQHDTQGAFRSVAVVSEGNVDAIYVIVSRYVQPGANCGSGWYDFIERFDNRKFDCSEDVWFLDCAASLDKNFPAFNVYTSGPIGDFGGNVEMCVAPGTILPRNTGQFTAVGAASNFTQGVGAGLHGYFATVFDWDNQVWYYIAEGAGSTNMIHVFNMTNFNEINTWAPLGLGYCGGANATSLGYDSNIYGVSGQTGDNAVRFNVATQTITASWTDLTDAYAPSFCQAMQIDGHNMVWYYVGNAATTAGVAWGIVDMDALPVTRLQNGSTTVNFTSLGPSFVVQTRSLSSNIAYGFVNSQDQSYTAFVRCTLTGTTAGSVGVALVLNIAPSSVHAAATQIAISSACLDETDGNIVALFIINGSTYYMTKVNSGTGAIMWSTQVTTNVDFRTSRIQFGMLSYIGTNQVYLFNTATGTYTTEAETVANGTTRESTSDAYGQVIWNINDIGTQLWATFGQAPPPAWASPQEIVQIGCGKIQVTSITNSYELQGNVLIPLTNAMPYDPNGVVLPAESGDYSVTMPTATITGLWHLEGKQVMATADGGVVGPFTVTNGTITLPYAATNVVVGLAYSAQLQTLYLDAQGPNMQGKRKSVSACTVRVAQSRGPKVGRTFNPADLVEMQDLMVMPGQIPLPLVTGDFREVVFSDWETTGQICIQQDYPLPLTVLGVIPEFTRGDTAN